ncbi:hypothetical protein CROQUDRAFT_79671 [Cronartium quercuum f. sp. fusiforme G11]|uniref:UDP-N-acetylglucosamine transferase subunit ALG14 n=1 Tax=Cronartium quercuum f. sp. fusiforme G11 TaxID=708437 RepID=A0A9P6TA30_9BASI|nr:hypothetical protein CROQUDRAFT_79671 [Cronartium quercuum f. sp. fusiforme G11]
MAGLLTLTIGTIIAIILRILQTIRKTHLKKYKDGKQHAKTCHTSIFLGSGGHTSEMIRLLSDLPFDRYTPRQYIISSGDNLSKTKVIKLESTKSKGHYYFLEIPRARKVHQSFITTPFTTILSLSYCIYHFTFTNKFDLILLNGPGSSVPIAISSFIPKIFSFKTKPKMIYVESFARINKLSLTGKILLPFMDLFIVQWDQLFFNLFEKSSLYNFLRKFNLVSNVVFDGWMV